MTAFHSTYFDKDSKHIGTMFGRDILVYSIVGSDVEISGYLTKIAL